MYQERISICKRGLSIWFMALDFLSHHSSRSCSTASTLFLAGFAVHHHTAITSPLLSRSLEVLDCAAAVRLVVDNQPTCLGKLTAINNLKH